MAEHDPADVEWMVRFMCITYDVPIPKDPCALQITKNHAKLALDYMQANGCKVTTAEQFADLSLPSSPLAAWDQAPLTPRDK